jgi:hypothetical protein
MVFANFNAELDSLPLGISSSVIGKGEEHRRVSLVGEQKGNVLYMFATGNATTTNDRLEFEQGNYLGALDCRRRRALRQTHCRAMLSPTRSTEAREERDATADRIAVFESSFQQKSETCSALNTILNR